MTDENLKQLAENPKEFLNRAFNADKRIELIRRRIERLRDKAAGISLTFSDAPSFNNTPSRKVEDCVVAIIELEEELAEEAKALSEAARVVRAAIKRFTVTWVELAILEMRYIDGYSWEVIAAELGYSYRWALRVHGKALSTVQTGAKKALNL